VVVVLAVAFGLRLAWVLYATRTPVFVGSGDAYSYFFYGRQMAEGGGYLNLDGSGHATAYYPVGYPAVLAALFWLLLHTPLPHTAGALAQAGTLLNAVLGTISVGLLWLIVRRVAGPRPALAAAALLALWPNAIAYTATLQLETAFTAAALGVLAILATHDGWTERPPSWRRLALFGAALGLSALIRPFSMPFAVLPVLLVLASPEGRRPRTVARTVAAVAVPLLLVLTPWTLRNQHALGAPLPFSSNLGDTVCLDRNLDAEGGFRFADHDGCADPSLGEVERNRQSTAKAIDFVRSHPGREALQIVRRARLILGRDDDGLEAVERGGQAPLLSDTGRRVADAAANGWFLVLLAAAVAGAVRSVADRRTRRPELLLLGLPALSLLATAVLLWGTPRFHAPLVPFLAAFAALAAFPAPVRHAVDTGRDPVVRMD
jgi:hypothetical protein